MRWEYIWVTFELDLSETERDSIKQNAFYSDEALKLKHIWVTFKSDLNKMFKSDLDKIWIRFKQERDEMQFNMMMHRWN